MLTSRECRVLMLEQEAQVLLGLTTWFSFTFICAVSTQAALNPPHEDSLCRKTSTVILKPHHSPSKQCMALISPPC
ncbi:hypothetical protein EMIT0215P_90098 [Pseudomonas serboccidentalis]